MPEAERKDLKFFDRVSAKELLELDLDDLIIERPIFTFLQRAKASRSFRSSMRCATPSTSSTPWTGSTSGRSFTSRRVQDERPPAGMRRS